MKHCFLIIILSGISLQCLSQHYGIKIGPNISTIRSENSRSINTGFGFQIGTFSEMAITEAIYFKPEFVISHQRISSNDNNFKIWYVQMPLAFQYNLNPGYLLTGIQFSIPFHTNAVSNYIKPIDVAIPIGIGIYLSDKLNLEIRYNHSITNLNNSIDFEAPKDFFSTLQVSVLINLPKND